MSRRPWELQCEPWDRLRYVVTSESDPAVVYLVDLAEWECSCMDFACRWGPVLNVIGRPFEIRHEFSCKHLRRAVRFLWSRDIAPSIAGVEFIRKLPAHELAAIRWGLCMEAIRREIETIES